MKFKVVSDDENQYETEFEHSNQIDSEQFNQKTSANINTGVLNGQIVSQKSANGSDSLLKVYSHTASPNAHKLTKSFTALRSIFISF